MISSGSRAPGTILDNTIPEFQKQFKEADIIISKGQGNLECLYGTPTEIFYLLKAKCQPVANLLGVKVGNLVFILNE